MQFLLQILGLYENVDYVTKESFEVEITNLDWSSYFNLSGYFPVLIWIYVKDLRTNRRQKSNLSSPL